MSNPFEEHVTSLAQDLKYPEMPSRNIAITKRDNTIMRRVAVMVLVIGLAGFAISDIRAAVFEILQIGAVTITLEGTDAIGNSLQLADLSGEMALEDAVSQVSFEVYIPPDDLPDKIFLQDRELLILVWLDGKQIKQVLYQVPTELWGISKSLDDAEIASVHDERAVWGTGDHFVSLTDGTNTFTHFVTDRVLIWTDGVVTFRLEVDMPLEGAQDFAESLVVYGQSLP